MRSNDPYNKLVSAAQLEMIRLISGQFLIPLPSEDEISNGSGFFSQQVRGEIEHRQDIEVVAGAIECKTWMVPDGSQPHESTQNPRMTFEITAVYFVSFKIPGKHNKTDVKAFFSRTAPFAVWPYFRAHVAMIAAESGARLHPLPMLSILPSERPVDSN